MTKRNTKPVKYSDLEALIFIYLLIVAGFCVHDYENWHILASCLVALAPIKILAVWFKVGSYARANYKGDISDLIICLGQEGFAPKTAGANSYILTTNLYLFPNSWCIIKYNDFSNTIIATNSLITKLSSKSKNIELMEKAHIGIENDQPAAHPNKGRK